MLKRVNPESQNSQAKKDSLSEPFAQLKGATMTCADCRSPKLCVLIMDSRLRRNDGKFCKDLISAKCHN